MLNKRSIPKVVITVCLTVTCGLLFMYQIPFPQKVNNTRNNAGDFPQTKLTANEGKTEKPASILVPANSDLAHKHKQRCIEDLMQKPTVFSRNSVKWGTTEVVCPKCFDYPNVTMDTQLGKTPIYIYDNNDYISVQLKKKRRFEPDKLDIIHKLLDADPAINFIDIGSNIGSYTLPVAKYGRKVLAVEALDVNLQHLCASVYAGNLQSSVYLVYNALFDNHTTVQLGVHRNNMGGTYVDDGADHVKKLKLGRAVGHYGMVDTILMDDLLELPIINEFSKAVIKMDVEGLEARSLSKSYNLFKKINISGVIMEWVFYRGIESANDILKFMEEHGYKPFKVAGKNSPLDISKRDSWPNDIVWLPK